MLNGLLNKKIQNVNLCIKHEVKQSKNQELTYFTYMVLVVLFYKVFYLYHLTLLEKTICHIRILFLAEVSRTEIVQSTRQSLICIVYKRGGHITF